MNLEYKKYLHNIYLDYLKNKDILFFSYNKNLNYKDNLDRIKKTSKKRIKTMALNKNVFKINLVNSIFISLNNIVTSKMGLVKVNQGISIDYNALCGILKNNTLFLMKLYNKVYPLVQLKLLNSLSYNYNVKLYLINIKRTVNSFINLIKIKLSANKKK